MRWTPTQNLDEATLRKGAHRAIVPFGQACVTLLPMTGGLRERKRRQVANALAKAAFDLAKERGVSGYTVDELTERAGYARRTFANYYSCKEDAITALALEQLHAGIASLPENGDELPLLDWVQRLAKHQLSSGLMDLLIELEVLARDNPSLEPYLAKVYAEIPLVAWEAVHERFKGRVPRQKVGILVGAVYGALSTMLTQLPHEFFTSANAFTPDAPTPDAPTPDARRMESLLDNVFEQLRAGF